LKRFDFRLHKLLHLRESLERLQGTALGHAEIAAQSRRDDTLASESQLDAVHLQLDAAVDVQAAGMRHAIGMTVDAARDRVASDSEALATAEAAQAAELQLYIEARSARRALEMLRERRYADWQIDARRFEREEGDEVARRQIAARKSDQ
jgi:flagellar export protein FliJ